MSSPTYTIVAGDGQTYGANSHETIQSWIREGRVARETQMARSDVEGWFRAGDYQEFAWPAEAVTPTQPSAPEPRPFVAAAVEPLAHPGIADGASWLFWIAGLSLVNFVILLSGSNFGFAIGCLAVDAMAALGHGGNFVFLAIGALLIALWAGLGVFARRGHVWAFAVGIVFYALDCLLLLVAFDMVSAAIHGWILFKLFGGLKGAWELRRQR